MPKFRKKPVEIEAWTSAMPLPADVPVRFVAEINMWQVYDTLHDTWVTFAHGSDWIIRGVAGEFYPCRPDVFEMTYEAVE